MSTLPLTVLVIGATGSIGRLVVEEAIQQGHAVRALVRDPARACRLPAQAQIVIGDVTRPGWFDCNGPDEHRLVLLQGDTRRAGAPSDGVIARRQIAEMLGPQPHIRPGGAQDLRTRRRSRPCPGRRRQLVRRSRRRSVVRAGRCSRHGEHAVGGRTAAGA